MYTHKRLGSGTARDDAPADDQLTRSSGPARHVLAGPDAYTGAMNLMGPGGRQRNLASVLGLLHRNGPLSRAALTDATGLNRSTIADLGLDIDRLEDALHDGAPQNHVADDEIDARSSDLPGTPSFYLGVGDAVPQRHVGPYDAATLIAALERMRADTPA